MTPIRMRAWAAVAALSTVAGCDRGRQAADVAPPTARDRQPQDPQTKVPRPDAARIAFDPATRTLELYALADPAAKWMLHLPDEPTGVPVGEWHQFMDEVEPERVAVFYVTAAGQPSPRVTLRDILTARDTRAGR